MYSNYLMKIFVTKSLYMPYITGERTLFFVADGSACQGNGIFDTGRLETKRGGIS